MKNQTNTTTPASAFDLLKRNFEKALENGLDTSAPLLDLSAAVARSVLNKCIDPQRKTAADRQAVSNNGQNPALLAMRKGITADLDLLDKTRRNADKAEKLTYTADGDLVTETADKAAAVALSDLMGQTLTDGIDLVQTAALAILEQTAAHADGGGEWLDRPFTVSRLSKRVYIQAADSAAYKEVITTPIQEVYREVRRAIQNSRAVQTDPRNGYLYLEEMTENGLDTIYRRMRKWENLGGEDGNGLCTIDGQTAADYDAILTALNLTPRQEQVLHLRMQGRGYKAIATYLGVTQRAIAKTVEQVQKKALAIGLDPQKLTAGEE